MPLEGRPPGSAIVSQRRRGRMPKSADADARRGRPYTLSRVLANIDTSCRQCSPPLLGQYLTPAPSGRRCAMMPPASEAFETIGSRKRRYDNITTALPASRLDYRRPALVARGAHERLLDGAAARRDHGSAATPPGHCTSLLAADEMTATTRARVGQSPRRQFVSGYLYINTRMMRSVSLSTPFLQYLFYFRLRYRHIMPTFTCHERARQSFSPMLQLLPC